MDTLGAYFSFLDTLEALKANELLSFLPSRSLRLIMPTTNYNDLTTMTSCFLFLVAASILISTSTIPVVTPFTVSTTIANNIDYLSRPFRQQRQRQDLSILVRHQRHHQCQRQPAKTLHNCSCGRSSAVSLSASTGEVDGSDNKRISENRNGSLFTNVQNFFRRFTERASVSHILLKCEDGTAAQQLANQLEDWKVDIDNSPVKFAEYAARYSECPSSSSGGDLGEFGPGTMVKPFNDVVFDKKSPDGGNSSSSSYLYDVGVVHGPIRTQFGYHLIYIRDRTE